jgi:hypothetical protein
MPAAVTGASPGAWPYRPSERNRFADSGGNEMRGNLGAIALILIGILALAINLGLLEVDFAQLLRTWWPVLLIIVGVGMFLAPDTDAPRKRN